MSPLRRSRLAGLLLASLFGLVALLVAACGNDASASSEVIATTSQIGALTKAVAGDSFEVHTLIGPGVDPHDYEATAADIKRLSTAKIVLRNGIGLDDFLNKAIAGSGAGNIVTVTDGIAVRHAAEAAGQSAGSTGTQGDADPHVWHDPMNDKIMVDNIVKALSAAFPDQAATFRTNGDAYNRKLDFVDAQIRALIESIPPANRKMVTDHDAFGYFIDRYGLTYVGAVIPGTSTQGEASSKQVAELEDTIKREGVKAIFAEGSVDPKVARQIADDTHVAIVADLYGDSLGVPGSAAATVDGMLLANATKIAGALR